MFGREEFIRYCVQARVWFSIGYGEIAVFFAILNFGMTVVITLTVKGIEIPLFMSIAILAIVFTSCVALGCAYERYRIQSLIQSYLNTNLNPELDRLVKDMAKLKMHLGVPDE